MSEDTDNDPLAISARGSELGAGVLLSAEAGGELDDGPADKEEPVSTAGRAGATTSRSPRRTRAFRRATRAGRRTRRARGPLLQPVRALLDARLRLSPRPRRGHRAPIGAAGEGTKDPLGKFEASLDGVSDDAKERFYSGNFAELFALT